jgi:tRNA-dependent cyclodipeptide synthase
VNRDQDIKENSAYLVAYASVTQLYNTSSKFKSSVDTTSASVLHNAGQELTDENVQQATHYLLSEIAFLEFAPDYFGVNKI